MTTSTRSRSYGRKSSGNIANFEAPHNPEEEEAYLQAAIQNSLQESKGPPPAPAAITGAPPTAPSTDDNLIDFFGDTTTAPAAPAALPALPPSTNTAHVPWGAPVAAAASAPLQF